MRIWDGVSLSATGREIVAIVDAGYPGRNNVYVTSGIRNGDPGYHGRGLAVDFGADSQGPKDDLAAWLYQYYSVMLELIHTRADGGSGWYAKDGGAVGGGYYGPATVQQHINHVHIAVDPSELATFRRIAVQAATPKVDKMAFGLDYISGPPISAMKAAGVSFVSRYVCQVNNQTQFKIFSGQEALNNSQSGIAMVTNYEWYESRSTEGYNAGVNDAHLADGMARDRGMPADRPIYFSVDFDASVGQVSEYFRGVNDAIGVVRTGVYGSYGICKDLKAQGRVQWCWQTYAWSGGQWFSGNNVEQYQNGVKLAGADVDYNRSKTADFGQWYHVSLGRQPDGVGSEIDMTPEQAAQLTYVADHVKHVEALAWRIDALSFGSDTVRDGPTKDETMWAVVKLKELANQASATGGLTDVDRAAIKALTDAVTALDSRLSTP